MIRCSEWIRMNDSRIRIRILLSNQVIDILRVPGRNDDTGPFCSEVVARLTFTSELDTAEFVDAAFPNCIFEDVDISPRLNKNVTDAIGRVSDSVIVNEALQLHGSINSSRIKLVRKFRNVKVCSFTVYIITEPT